jgi:hypothetical protein
MLHRQMSGLSRYGALVASLGAVTLTYPAIAHAETRTLCVYDPSGRQGDIFNMLKDYQAAASKWGKGLELKLKPYTDEKTAAEDFKAKQCHAVLMTGTRSRQFQKFAGTVEAMGALKSYKQLKSVVKTLSSPKAGKFLTSGEYQVAGIFPGGAVYMLVRDRTVDSVKELAGKRVATLEYDDAAKTMVRKVGASLVAADVGTFAGMFNNGSVDACYAPATAYEALELGKGVGSKGGVIRYPLAQLTLQLLVRTQDFPAGFPAKSRAYAAKNFDRALRLVTAAEKKIPAKAWVDIPDKDKGRYDEMFLNVRIQLRDKDKIYHRGTLKLLRKIRCKSDGDRAECAQPRE